MWWWWCGSLTLLTSSWVTVAKIKQNPAKLNRRARQRLLPQPQCCYTHCFVCLNIVFHIRAFFYNINPPLCTLSWKIKAHAFEFLSLKTTQNQKPPTPHHIPPAFCFPNVIVVFSLYEELNISSLEGDLLSVSKRLTALILRYKTQRSGQRYLYPPPTLTYNCTTGPPATETVSEKQRKKKKDKLAKSLTSRDNSQVQWGEIGRLREGISERSRNPLHFNENFELNVNKEKNTVVRKQKHKTSETAAASGDFDENF